MRACFTLAIVTSADGFIARFPGELPSAWASPEEQALFFAAVDAADWAIMGRATHEAADRPDRRRIVFSAQAGPGDWRRASQFWINPVNLGPADLAALVCHIHPLQNGLILGGTRVHDWFLAAGAIDVVKLTIEPVHFGTGLPVFSGQAATDPVALFTDLGYAVSGDRTLNARRTRFVTLCRGADCRWV